LREVTGSTSAYISRLSGSLTKHGPINSDLKMAASEISKQNTSMGNFIHDRNIISMNFIHDYKSFCVCKLNTDEIVLLKADKLKQSYAFQKHSLIRVFSKSDNGLQFSD